MVLPHDDAARVSGDPIQQLFTTLGKFHRHLTKAQNTPEHEGWCDECMEELMAGLEIAMACEWTPVKDALIDAARILHSYEKSGKPAQSLPFLKDSYEILSLMVGDLIVDTVRAGVKQKWRDHYMKAIETLESQGITLVEDDDVESSSGRGDLTARPAPAPMSEEAPGASALDSDVSLSDTEMDAPLDEPMSGSEERIMAEDDAPPFELPPLTDDSLAPEDETASHEPGDIVPFPSASPETVQGSDDSSDAAAGDSGSVQSDEMSDLRCFDQLPDEMEAEEDAAQEMDAAEAGTEADTELQFVEEDYRADAEDISGTADVSDEIYVFEAPEPVESGREETDTRTAPAVDAQDDSFLADAAPDDTAFEDMRDAQAAEDAPDAAPAQGDATAISETLLRKAREAMSKGDVRNAKAVALELAATMARVEYEQAQRDLAEAEQQLVDNARTIEQAEAVVEKNEQELSHIEELLAARDSEGNACRERIGGMDEELSVLSSELADIEAQITALQKKRTEQMNRLENKREERQEAVDGEGRLQTEMEALSQETESMRARVQAAREHVNLQRTERRKIEHAIHIAHEEAESRRLSLLAIERTLHPDADSDTAPAPQDEADTLL